LNHSKTQRQINYRNRQEAIFGDKSEDEFFYFLGHSWEQIW
jgi:hypothetical protein